ncbi:MAG TPA: hypothetical protein VEX68_12540 [Bryobacteraceae bacterium]|nr:hypothetical protein [Bryobacteraceae bacterium]
MNAGFLKMVLWMAVLPFTAAAQLAEWNTYLPKRDKPPVVFVTGHDSICPDPRSGETPFFQLTFGDFDKVMARDGRISLVFEACYAPNRPSIGEIANVLRQMLAQLRYESGDPVREVDMVAHSMGGLIVRAYISGKQTNGSFATTALPGIRKVIFLGTPHFGTPVAVAGSEDPQLREMSLGSAFLFDLATWNQGSDDLRGVDALSIAGTGGKNGPATDSVVRVSSASLDFIATGRTAVLPYCHTQGGIGNLFLCEGAPGLARVGSEDHPTAQLVLAFLNDRDSWRSSTVAAGASGVMAQSRTADDLPRPIQSATFLHDNGSVTQLAISRAGYAHADSLPAGEGTLSIDGVTRRITLLPGGTRAHVIKTGPWIEAVEPAAGRSWPLVLAPGMLVSIRGLDLNVGSIELFLGDKPIPVLSVSNSKLTALIPEDVIGLGELRLRNSAGQHMVRVFLESAFPALFLQDGVAAALHSSSGKPVSDADPAAPGEVISLFLTGLGAGVALEQPVVTIADRQCEVLYAGRAPSLAGVDQINCRLSSELEVEAGRVRVRVTSGNRNGAADLPYGSPKHSMFGPAANAMY